MAFTHFTILVLLPMTLSQFPLIKARLNPFPSRSLLSYTADDYLIVQNTARQAVGVSALTWNNNAAVQAQQWANQLAQQNNCNMQHGDSQGYGQNMAWNAGLMTPEQAAQMWVNERDHYTLSEFDAPQASGCSTGNWDDCGHYTQLVWKATTSVGCGGQQCSNGATIIVCDYYPAGNVVGQSPY